MSNSTSTYNLIQSIGPNLTITDKQLSRYQQTNIFRLVQNFKCGHHSFSMEKHMVLNPFKPNILYHSDWQLIPFNHNLQLTERESEFSFLINKNYSNKLYGSNTPHGITYDELKSCFSDLQSTAYPYNLPSEGSLSSTASEVVGFIINNLDHIHVNVTPSIAKCCLLEIQLHMQDRTFFSMTHSYMLDSFNEIFAMRNPDLMPVHIKEYSDNPSKSFAQTFHTNPEQSSCTTPPMPNQSFPNEALSEAFGWIFENRLDLCLHLQSNEPIIQSKIINSCIHGY